MTDVGSGVAWSADVLEGGRKVGQVANRGDGGANRYHWSNPEAGRRFTIVARAASARAFEPEGEYVEALTFEPEGEYVDALIREYEARPHRSLASGGGRRRR